VDFNQREDVVRDLEMKTRLFTSGDISPNDSLHQTLKLDAAKAASGPPARLRSDYSLHGNAAAGIDDRCAGNAGKPVTSAETTGEKLTRRLVEIRGTSKSWGAIILYPSIHT
jgi:hypothetical protein